MHSNGSIYTGNHPEPLKSFQRHFHGCNLPAEDCRQHLISVRDGVIQHEYPVVVLLPSKAQ